MEIKLKPRGNLPVKALREFLKNFPDDMPVATEGCDCYGPSDGAELYAGTILIKRNDDLPYPWKNE